MPVWNFNPSSRDRFHPTIIAWRNIFLSRQGGTGFHLLCIYKNAQIPFDLKMLCLSCLVFSCAYSFLMRWWNFIKIFVLFFTEWRHMRRKNIIGLSMIYWNVFLWIFSNRRFLLIFLWKHVLNNFFIRLRGDYMGKFRSGNTKVGYCLVRMKLFTSGA